MQKKFLIFLLSLIACIFLVIRTRVIEYLGLKKTTVVVKNEKKADLVVYFLYPNSVSYSKSKLRGYFDTLVVYKNFRQIVNHLPEKYGENRFLISFNGKIYRLNCGTFKYRKWHRFKAVLDFNLLGDTLALNWRMKMNFVNNSGSSLYFTSK